MNTLERGAQQAVINCLRIQPEERVVIITDKETRIIANALRGEAGKVTPNITLFLMEDFGERPIIFPPEIGRALQEADVSFYAAQSFKGELQTFRIPMLGVVSGNSKLRHGHMPGVTHEIMITGMCADYRKVQKLCGDVYEKVRNASFIRVATNRGTDATIRLSPKLKWRICDGNIAAGHWSNLPDGEVFTSPSDVNGRIVIDGCLGDYFDKKFGLLHETPVSVEIRNGRAVRKSIHCKNRKLKREFSAYLFETDKNSHRVGEFAIGTNIGLKELIGNLLQDEKFPGVHIAFGSPLPKETGADWDSDGHIDGVIKNATVLVDGEMIMANGNFMI